MIRTIAPVWALLALVAVDCGGGPEPTPTAVPQSDFEEEEQYKEVGAVGIMGTIPTIRIHERFEMKLRSFERCFREREKLLPYIGGHVEFYLRVALNGSVRWVYLRNSSVGDRKTERCLLDIVRRMKFPRPRGGGEAEIGWDFDRDPDPDVRVPVKLDARRAAYLVRENARPIAACGIPSSTVTVTAYVAPGGRVAAAGAHSSYRRAAEDAVLDCVTEKVSGWTLPDPGSYAGKISFDVPRRASRNRAGKRRR
jgi:hypothetical protein